MSRANESPGARLRSQWQKLSRRPGGRRLFNLLLGRMVPYTGTMGARVVHFEHGHTRVQLRDRRRVRNHLHSIHAVALANLGELSTGLAVVGALGPEARAILTGLQVTYLKKARGLLEAETRVDVPHPVTENIDLVATAQIKDGVGDVVAITNATWRLSPTRDPART